MESDSVCNHTRDFEIGRPRFAGVWFRNHEYDYGPTLDDTQSYYQLIINIIISEEYQTKFKTKICLLLWWFLFLSSLWLVHLSLNLVHDWLIQLSDYKQSVRLAINRGVYAPITFEEIVIVK